MKQIKQINKKGQLSSLPQTLIFLTAAVIILVIVIVMISSLKSADIVNRSGSGSFTNQTVTSVNQLGDLLTSASNCFATVQTAINATSGNVIDPANYTVTGCYLFAVGTGNIYNNTNWNVTYSYVFSGETFNAANKSLAGFDDFADFFPLIVLSVVSAVIVGIVLTSFTLRKKGR